MLAGQIFFSYSRADAAFALKLGEDLRKAGIDIWIDQIDIRPSEPWDEEIEKALQASECLLVILSKNSVASDNVLNEINYALESKKQVLPILLERDIKKPLNIIRLQHIDFTGSYEKGYAVLLNSLHSGQPVNTVNRRTSRMIVPISIVILVIIIAGLLIKRNANRSGNVDGSTLFKDSAVSKVDSSKNLAALLNGTWSTQEVTNPFDEHDQYTIHFTLEVFDTVLVGNIDFKSTVEDKNYHIQKGFLGGRIKANTISFHTEEKYSGEDGERYKNYYTGIVLNDEIRFTLQSDRPGGFPGQRFVARRGKEWSLVVR